MKKIRFYEQDDVVMVIDKGFRYSAYSDLFKFYGYDKERFYDFDNPLFKELKENYLYKVLRQVVRREERNTQILFIQDTSGYVYAIGVEGVRLFKLYKWA